MDSTFLGLPYSEWRFINSFAPWLSAIATIVGVTIALIIFRKDRFMLLKFDIMVYTDTINPDAEIKEYDSGICLVITNQGFRAVIISQIDLIHENCFLMTASEKVYKIYRENLKVPIPILGQESINVYYSSKEFKERIEKKSDLFEFNVRTSIGKSYRLKIPNDLTARFLSQQVVT